MNKVLLIGIGGTYNYGCEAIVRGTVTMLRSRWPDIEIVLATPRPGDDGNRLSNCGINFLPRNFNRYSLSNLTRKVLSIAGIDWQPRIDDLSLLKDVDAVFSIGGDIYTLNESNGFNAALAKFGNAVVQRGLPYILWGASVGPFTKNPRAENFFAKHLKGITGIVAREEGTITYLKSIGVVDNVFSVPDPAFSVAPGIVKVWNACTNRPKIGINLSPLSVKHLGLTPEAATKSHAKAIERIILACDAEIILLPHVVCAFNPIDDDLAYLSKIRDAIPECSRKNVSLVDNDPGFIGLKKMLVRCDVVVAARMHCAINAMTAHVPTLLLSYSQKSKGMAEFVYGERSLVITLDRFNEHNIEAEIKNLLNKKEDIHLLLRQTIPKIQDLQSKYNFDFLTN
jgi:polysaccharide pyruvyl transferase WcaK-like protein